MGKVLACSSYLLGVKIDNFLSFRVLKLNFRIFWVTFMVLKKEEPLSFRIPYNCIIFHAVCHRR